MKPGQALLRIAKKFNKEARLRSKSGLLEVFQRLLRSQETILDLLQCEHIECAEQGGRVT